MSPVYIRPGAYSRWCVLRHYVHGASASTLCFARIHEDLEFSLAPAFADRCTACTCELEALRRGGPTAPTSPEDWERQAQGACREWDDAENVSTRR